MHEHKWKVISKREQWKKSPEQELLMSYEIKINRCDCGEERRIKSAPKGIWWKGAESHLERVKTYPENWKKVLKDWIRCGEGEITVMLDRFVRSGLSWAEAEELAQNLVVDVIAEKFEKYPNRTTRDVRINIKGEAFESLWTILGLNKIEEEVEAVTAFFDDWERLDTSDTPAGNIIAGLADIWRKERRPVLPLRDGTVKLRSLLAYRLIMNTLKTIALLSLSGENIPFRELSIRVSGDSKGLIPVKSYLKRLLGNLEDYGITEHSPLIFCRIPVTGEVNKLKIDLSAAADYAVLTESTALRFKPLHGNFNSLLLIENQTTFEAAVANLPDGMGCIFLSGYPPHHIQSFVKNLLEFNQSLGYIWCDIDPDGIEIALTAGKWFEDAGCNWQPLGMDKETLLSASTKKPLDERDRNKIKELKTKPEAKNFHVLLEEMENRGEKVEQEVLGKFIDNFLKPFKAGFDIH